MYLETEKKLKKKKKTVVIDKKILLVLVLVYKKVIINVNKKVSYNRTKLQKGNSVYRFVILDLQREKGYHITCLIWNEWLKNKCCTCYKLLLFFLILILELACAKWQLKKRNHLCNHVNEYNSDAFGDIFTLNLENGRIYATIAKRVPNIIVVIIFWQLYLVYIRAVCSAILVWWSMNIIIKSVTGFLSQREVAFSKLTWLFDDPFNIKAMYSLFSRVGKCRPKYIWFLRMLYSVEPYK